MSQLRAFIAGCVAVALAVAFAETVASSKSTRFDEITVQRINIVEPDGTKRIIISNRTKFPGDFMRGKEGDRPDRRQYAGMLFINDEGTENGGFIQNGKLNKDGNVDAALSLTFDRFRQDQALQLVHDEDGSDSVSSVRINDVPYYQTSSIDDLHRFADYAAKMSPDDQKQYFEKLKQDGKVLQNRIYLGTTSEHNAALELKDKQGKPRLRLMVADSGEASVEFLGDDGAVLKRIGLDR
jgi:hypothetical protein